MIGQFITFNWGEFDTAGFIIDLMVGALFFHLGRRYERRGR
jgi:hypothetical protein